MVDKTSAYYDKPSTHNARLTEVGKGTPCGEFLRRYWHPIAVAAKVTAVPQRIRALGEDLILYRDLSGRLGLLKERCTHRGASLYYGKVDEDGISCCYHGWKFDARGKCLDQPCEPGGGERKERFIQPWYPVQEQYGLVFAYMGPLDKMPVVPRYDILEHPEPGATFVADDSNLPSGADSLEVIPCNWLQRLENVIDVFHVYVLHATFSGAQFIPEFNAKPRVEFEMTDYGSVLAHQHRQLPNGRQMNMVNEVLLPTVRVVPGVYLTEGKARTIGWVLPIDDTHYRLFSASWMSSGYKRAELMFNGKHWSEMSEAEHQRYPGDYEAQTSQGPITHHSAERLTQSDQGVIMLRKLIDSQIKAVEAGKDPLGAAFTSEAALIRTNARNDFWQETAAG